MSQNAWLPASPMDSPVRGEVRVRPFSLFCACLIVIELFFLAALAAQGQSGPPPATSSQAASGTQDSGDHPAAEMTSREDTTFKVNVKLVLVRVVVRDKDGHAVGNLGKDDFQLFDKGKPQAISQFAGEQSGVLAAKELATSNQKPEAENAPTPAAEPKAAPAAPERFVAYMFDDEHLQFANLVQVREAALRHFKTLRPTDRAAVFTTSGKNMLDFTDDRAKLQDALLRIRPITADASDTNPCPDISYYMADLIVNKNDSEALRVAIQEYLNCSQNVRSSFGAGSGSMSAAGARQAAQIVPSTAQQVLSKGDMATQISLGVVKDVVNKLAYMPGQRSLILVSPGFLTPQSEPQYEEIIDRAVRGQVVISALDARGLFVQIPGGDASKRGLAIDPDPSPGGDKGGLGIKPGTDPKNSVIADPGVLTSQYESRAATEETNILATLANSTGGNFFHNSNDFDDGFRRTAETPEYSYLLAFAPQNIKPDGSFHALKVTLKNPGRLTVQARLGYYAPKHFDDPAEQAKQEIQEAMFSREEMRDLPVDLHTQFFKASEDAATLTVLAHMDAHHLHFHKAEGRNNDEVTFVSALFNQNGDFLKGNQKVVTLRLKDETLDHKLGNGITMKTSFDVKPGNYLVRIVVRDADGQLSAESGAIDIP